MADDSENAHAPGDAAADAAAAAAAAPEAAAAAAANVAADPAAIPVPASPVQPPTVFAPPQPPGIPQQQPDEVAQLRQQLAEVTAQLQKLVQEQKNKDQKEDEEDAEENGPRAKRTKQSGEGSAAQRRSQSTGDDPWTRWQSPGRGVKREATEEETQPAESRGLGTARFGRVIRTARRSRSPAAKPSAEEDDKPQETW